MRRRHRRSAQLTFVMEFPAGEQSSSSTSGSLWSQIYLRTSPQQHHPAISTADNGFPSSGSGHLAAATGHLPPATPLPANRLLLICRHWFYSVGSHCTSCMPRQRVYGLSQQQQNQLELQQQLQQQQQQQLQLQQQQQQQLDTRFSTANAPHTRDPGGGEISSMDPPPAPGDDRYSGASAPRHHQRQLIHQQQQQQQQQQYRFTGASAPARPGYEHGSSNSDSPPYLPSREHHSSTGGGGWSGHQYQDRPV